MKNYAPFIALIAILAIIGIVLVNWFTYRLTRQLLDTHPPDEKIVGLIRDIWRPGREALKWGLLLLAGGLGLILDSIIPFDTENTPLGFGIEAVFLATGFLTYYALIQKKNNDK